MTVLLDPAGALDPAVAARGDGARAGRTRLDPGAPLPLLQSLLIVWPQIVSLIAGTIVLFVIGYVIFQRQEVRA